ncbi:MAG: carboxypeptidase regulatory-like domain-containing protein [Gemmatimonadaceae bacterium]|nr:carboxypeptidase regulatory-like domain-containing protein [Gemmatimonadaceae bacterium]
MTRRRVPRWLAFATALVLGACGGDASGPAAPTVAVVEVTPTAVALSPGQTRQFAAAPKTAAGVIVAGRTATWNSSSVTVATVDAAGLVTAVGVGTATVSATVDGKSGSATVTVTLPPVVSVTLTPSTAQQLPVSSSLQFTATPLDSAGRPLTGRTVTWSSSSTASAIVSTTGLVTGIAAGTTTITATCEGRSAAVAVTVTPNAGTTFALSGRVVEAPASTSLAGARVTATDPNGAILATTTTDATGNWSHTGIAAGSVVQLAISATGFVATTVATFTVTGALTVETAPLARTSASTGGVSGVARNASNNAALTTGVAVELREGMGATSGLALRTTTTAADGSYSLTGVNAGTYTVTMRANGFAESSRTVAITGGATVTAQDVLLSTSANANAWRAVLIWTAAGRDLDLYLTLPGAGTTRQQIYFAQPGNCGATPFACLDRDATAAPGPETITISQLGGGIYRFYVQNYNAPSSGADSTLMRSGAQLRIFRGTTTMATYDVPQQPGTLWTVAEVDGATGVITPRNVMGPGGPSDPLIQLVAPSARRTKSDPRLRLP